MWAGIIDLFLFLSPEENMKPKNLWLWKPCRLNCWTLDDDYSLYTKDSQKGPKWLQHNPPPFQILSNLFTFYWPNESMGTDSIPLLSFYAFVHVIAKSLLLRRHTQPLFTPQQ